MLAPSIIACRTFKSVGHTKKYYFKKSSFFLEIVSTVVIACTFKCAIIKPHSVLASGDSQTNQRVIKVIRCDRGTRGTRCLYLHRMTAMTPRWQRGLSEESQRQGQPWKCDSYLAIGADVNTYVRLLVLYACAQYLRTDSVVGLTHTFTVLTWVHAWWKSIYLGSACTV